jgi:hypothetical protein
MSRLSVLDLNVPARGADLAWAVVLGALNRLHKLAAGRTEDDGVQESADGLVLAESRFDHRHLPRDTLELPPPWQPSKLGLGSLRCALTLEGPHAHEVYRVAS